MFPELHTDFFSWYIHYIFFNLCITYHADFESVKEIKGQSGNQVDDEPGGHVMDADLPRIKDHLPRLTHVRSAETEHDIWWSNRQSRVSVFTKYSISIISMNDSVSTEAF